MSTSHDNRIVDLINFLLSIAGMLQFKQGCFLNLLESQSGQSFTVAGGKHNGLAFLFYQRSTCFDSGFQVGTAKNHCDKWGETRTFFNINNPYTGSKDCTLKPRIGFFIL